MQRRYLEGVNKDRNGKGGTVSFEAELSRLSVISAAELALFIKYFEWLNCRGRSSGKFWNVNRFVPLILCRKLAPRKLMSQVFIVVVFAPNGIQYTDCPSFVQIGDNRLCFNTSSLSALERPLYIITVLIF